MANNTGLAGLAVTALVAALVAFGVSALLGGPPPAPPPAAGGNDSAAVNSLRDEVARLRSDVKRAAGSGSHPATPASPGPAGAPSAGTSAPVTANPGDDTPLPATRADLVALIDGRITEKAAAGVGLSAPAAAARKRLSIEEAGEEMGLSSVEIDAARRVLRDSEMEMLTCVMGTADVDAIKEEAREAAEDPDKKAALINKAVGNMIRNLGRLATVEDRKNKELKRFLTPDQVTKLRGYDLKPTVADGELENVMKDVFGR